MPSWWVLSIHKVEPTREVQVGECHWKSLTYPSSPRCYMLAHAPQLEMGTLYKNNSTLVLNFLFATVREPFLCCIALPFNFQKHANLSCGQDEYRHQFQRHLSCERYTKNQGQERRKLLLSCALLRERKSRNFQTQANPRRGFRTRASPRRAPVRGETRKRRRLRYLGRSRRSCLGYVSLQHNPQS